LKISDGKTAILETMVILASAIAMPEGHSSDCVVTITVRRTPVRAAAALKWIVLQPVRDSDGSTRRGLAATAALISYGLSRWTATAT
jgi:hypothetical protein